MHLRTTLAASAVLFTLLQAFPAPSGPVAATDEPADAASRTVLRAAGWLLSRAVPDAMAVDLTADDSDPEVIFNDVDFDPDSGTERDWSIRATSNGLNSGSFAVYNDLGADIGVPVLRILSSGSLSAQEDTLVVNGVGDIDFVDYGVHFNRDPLSVSIGSDSTDEDFSIFSTEPGILLDDTDYDSRASLRLNQGYLYLATDPTGAPISRNTMRFALDAPESSFTINGLGDVGFGTATPIQAVDVERSEAPARFQLSSFTGIATYAPQFIQRRARGTALAPSAVLANDNLGLFSFRGHTGSSMGGSRATITAQATENFTDFSTPTRLIFAVTPPGSNAPQQVMVIENGQVKVNGENLNVPDYVFEEDYPLMPLEELRAFIDVNGHLPGIAPAHEVNSEGLDLAGSQMGQLQKIEELTLYTLQQEQRLVEQDRKLARLDAIESENRMLREELAALRSGLEEVRRQSGLD